MTDAGKLGTLKVSVMNLQREAEGKEEYPPASTLF